MRAHAQKCWFIQNLAKSQKNWAKKLRHILTILLKLYFVGVHYVIKKHIKLHKINKLFLVTECLSATV